MRQTPGSTLFPYTTLFRSLHGGDEPAKRPRASHARARHRADLHRPLATSRDDEPAARGLLRGRAFLAQGSALRRAPVDRKSTRLNSSHVRISYAVFCLKKK